MFRVNVGGRGPSSTDPWAARNALVMGVDQPNGSNTGYITDPSFTRTVVNGDQTLSTAGDQSYYHYDFNGRVKITSSGTKFFKNCRFYGNGALTSNTGTVDCTDSHVSDAQFEDCDFIPSTPTLWQDGIIGHHYSVFRCKFSHTVDGCGVYNTSDPTGALGVKIQQCYMDNFGWWNPDPNHADGSHTDGIQIQSGSGMQVLGNYIHAYFDTTIGNSPWSRVGDTSYRSLSCTMVTPGVGAVTNMTVDHNWFYGAEIQCNWSSAANAGNNLGTYTNNRHGRDSYYAGYTLQVLAAATYSASGNVYDDNSAAITIHTV